MQKNIVTPQGLPIISYNTYFDFASALRRACVRKESVELIENWLVLIKEENPAVLEYFEKITKQFGVPDIADSYITVIFYYALLRTALEASFKSRTEKRENILPKITPDTLDTIVQNTPANFEQLNASLETWTELIRSENKNAALFINRHENMAVRYCLAGTYILLRTQGEKNKAKTTQ